MSELKCEVVEIEVLPHENADALELAKVGDYLSVVQKGKYKTGDKVVYIPEQAELPTPLVKEMGLEGKLAGKHQNRVKAIKLRGVLSQGLVHPAKDEWEIGQDVRKELCITKWVPPVPVDLEGLVDTYDFQFKFDPENIKKYPDIIEEGEEVCYLEKIHGTFCKVTLLPENKRKDTMLRGKFAVCSKRHAHQGIYFLDLPENKNNVYLRAVKNTGVHVKLEKLVESLSGLEYFYPNCIISLVGEAYGKVQDLKYGVNGDVGFRAFGICIDGKKYLNIGQFLAACDEFGIETAPVLYCGPHTKEVLEKHTTGKEQVSGQETNIREGLVVYPAKEREHPEIGRVFLKSISEKYLLRKGGTEYN